MEFYYILYWSFFASIIGELLPLKQKKIIMMIWCVIFIFIGGLRWRIGGDWDQYYDHFLFSKWSNIFSYDRYGNGVEKLEPGFVFVNVLVKTLFKHFFVYNILLCSFIQITYYKFSNYFFPRHPLLCYCFLMILASNIFPVRAGFAIGIAFWCWRYIKERNLRKYLMIVFCAFVIHNQAIILFPAYFLGYIKLDRKWLLILYPIIAIFAFRFQEFFASLVMMFGGSIVEKARGYTEGETEGFSNTVNYAGWILNYIYLNIYLFIRKVDNKENDYFYNTLINGVMIYNTIFMVFATGMGDLARLSSQYFPSQCLLFINSTLFFFKYKKGKYKNYAIIFFLVYLGYRLSGQCSGYYFKDTCVPYKTIFDYHLV